MTDITQRIANLPPEKRELLLKRLNQQIKKVVPTTIQPQSRESNSFPLSFAQERLWLVDQLQPGNSAYNIPGAIRLQGKLNITALEQSINEIIRRHEVLRTTFTSVEGKPVQVIAASLSLKLTVINLSGMRSPTQEQEVKKLIAQESLIPFDLAQGPLVRVSLLHLSQTEYVMLFTIHHIVSDIWSMGVLVDELVALYPAFCNNQQHLTINNSSSALLPELPIQYADFAVWQRQRLQGEIWDTQLAYWKQQLKNLSMLQLPTDRPRPAFPTFQGATQSFVIPKNLTKALHSLSRSEGVTLFMTLLAAFKVLLNRYTGQDDICIGSPIANRNKEEIEKLIGFFVNSLVLRTNLSGNPTFRELLARVREVTLEAYAHQDFPFEKLVQELQPERNLSYHPLFQVIFQLQNAPMQALELPDLTLSTVDYEHETSAFDLHLSLSEVDEGISGVLQYSTELFDSARITRIIEHFQNLLSGIVANPETKLSELPLLTAAEQYQLLVEWNNTQVDWQEDLCIHQLIELQAEKTPDAIAVVFEQQQLTYQQLNQRANQVAHYLKTLGVKPEVLVGICIERSLDMIVGLLGILKAGGAYIPLDPSYPPERLAYMLADSQISVLLTQEKLVSVLPNHDSYIVCIDADWGTISQQQPNNPVSEVTLDNGAYVIYTSGSTGQPKGVQICHRSLTNFLNAMRQEPGLTAQDVFLAVTTISFDIAALELYLPLIVGAKLVIVPRQVAIDGAQLKDLLVKEGATTMQATPATWRLLLAAGWEGSQQLKILCGGEALPKELANQLLEKCAALWNMYGPTETTIWSTVYNVGANRQVVRNQDTSELLGRPIANTQIYILDSYLQPVPVGVPGELYIGGAGLARGYLNRPDMTTERFIPNPFTKSKDLNQQSTAVEAGLAISSNLQPTSIQNLSPYQPSKIYKTGDLARFLPNGNIEYLGRIDNQVKIRGFRIELGEIENALVEHPDVQQALVIARSEKFEQQQLVAYIIPSQEKPLPATLRTFLKQKLPEYMVPATFVFVDAWPLTPNGKIDRRSLLSIEQTRLEPEVSYVVARNPIEEKLVKVWSDILGVKQVGIQDNFFNLGGHSLLATQVMSRIRDTFNLELPLSCLFTSPTIAELAETINTKSQAVETIVCPPIEPVSRNRDLPLSFAQQRLWFLSQLVPDSSLYNISAPVRLTGSLDVISLEKSLNEVIQRHEILRTSFVNTEGQPVQVISPNLYLSLPIVDLQTLEPSAQAATVLKLATEEKLKPFDLTRCPLLRVTLLRLNETEYVLLLTMHHIISDGWSLGVLVQELATLYTDFSTGKSSSLLPPLPIQYADFAVWQREWLQGKVLEAQLNYWKQQLLGGNLPSLKLPTKQSQTQNLSFQGATYNFELNLNLLQKIQELSRQENVTLFMTLLAGLQTLLYRYTSQDDIVVGTDIANRNHSKTELLIGFFINLLVLRIDMRGNPSFRELLQRVREVTLQAYAHQDLPFEKLVDELRPERGLQPNPLFQVLFVLQNTPTPEIVLPNLTIHPLDIEDGQSKFDLALFAIEEEQKIIFTWKYKTDLFDADTLARMSNNFITLLTSIVAQPDTKINSLEMITDGEKKQQISMNTKRQAANFQKFKAIKPKAVSLIQEKLVKTNYLQTEENLPLVCQPNVLDLDVVDWAKSDRQFIETNLLKHGAILFRGFNANSVSDFENFAQAICPELFGEYGDLPREELGGKVYGSTPYPADKAILFHNESSHMHRWPMKIWFYCVQPAQERGETPIVDCRKIYQLLTPQTKEKFAQKGLMYVRNYTNGLDVSWQNFFHTEDKSAVENFCRQHAIQFEWKADGGLRTKEIRQAIAKHPKTEELVFFNQIQLHHIAYLDTSVRDSLLSLFNEEDLPRNVYYGDGTPIEESVINEITTVYKQAEIAFPWQKGDILMLDNMLAAHARNPYVGARKIVVAMGEIVNSKDILSKHN